MKLLEVWWIPLYCTVPMDYLVLSIQWQKGPGPGPRWDKIRSLHIHHTHIRTHYTYTTSSSQTNTWLIQTNMHYCHYCHYCHIVILSLLTNVTNTFTYLQHQSTLCPSRQRRTKVEKRRIAQSRRSARCYSHLWLELYLQIDATPYSSAKSI